MSTEKPIHIENVKKLLLEAADENEKLLKKVAELEVENRALKEDKDSNASTIIETPSHQDYIYGLSTNGDIEKTASSEVERMGDVFEDSGYSTEEGGGASSRLMSWMQDISNQ